MSSSHPAQGVGLLLGAGGIRGCAHAGVLSVLEEARVEADVVVGASIGSLFGAAYAAGWDIDRIATLTDRAPRRAVAEFYMNRLRIDGRTYIGRIMCELGKDTLIEDLPRKFAAMALDCTTGKVVALRSGPLLRSIEASIALPGIARPVTVGQATYIDGGLKGPIPVSVARDMGAEFVIHVELVGRNPWPAGPRRRYRNPLARTLSKRLAIPLNPAGVGPAPPRPSARGDESEVADVVIAPAFYGLFCNSPVGVRFSVRRGEVAARRQLGSLNNDRRNGEVGLRSRPQSDEVPSVLNPKMY